jgi:hypothetical protein
MRSIFILFSSLYISLAQASTPASSMDTNDINFLVTEEINLTIADKIINETQALELWKYIDNKSSKINHLIFKNTKMTNFESWKGFINSLSSTESSNNNETTTSPYQLLTHLTFDNVNLGGDQYLNLAQKIQYLPKIQYLGILNNDHYRNRYIANFIDTDSIIRFNLKCLKTIDLRGTVAENIENVHRGIETIDFPIIIYTEPAPTFINNDDEMKIIHARNESLFKLINANNEEA